MSERTAALVQRATFLGGGKAQDAAMRGMPGLANRTASFECSYDSVDGLGRKQRKSRDIGGADRVIGADHGEHGVLRIRHVFGGEGAIEREPNRSVRLAQQIGEIAFWPALALSHPRQVGQSRPVVLDHFIRTLICYQQADNS